jgi:hypothetical protein
MILFIWTIIFFTLTYLGFLGRITVGNKKKPLLDNMLAALYWTLGTFTFAVGLILFLRK